MQRKPRKGRQERILGDDRLPGRRFVEGLHCLLVHRKTTVDSKTDF
jgi:hypothetical protein